MFATTPDHAARDFKRSIIGGRVLPVDLRTFPPRCSLGAVLVTFQDYYTSPDGKRDDS